MGIENSWLVRLGCLLSAAIVVGFALYAGIFRPFTQVYDADLHYLYRALRFNSGLPQKYFDNIGYLNTLILSWWLQAVHALHLIPGATLDEVRSAAQPARAMALAIYAARIEATLLVLAFLAVIGYACARLTGSRVFGVAAAVLMAPTSGMAYHAITIRPELVSSLALAGAFTAILLTVGKGERRRLVLVGLAAGLAYLSFLTKMQAVIPLLFLPLVALFCAPPPRNADPEGPVRLPDTICLFLAAILVFLPFAVSHYFGVTELHRRSFPTYSWLLALYIVACVFLYGLIYARSLRSTAKALAAVMIGLGAAFGVNYFHFSHYASAADATFLDNLMLYGNFQHGAAQSANAGFHSFGGYLQLLSALAEKLGSALPVLFSTASFGQAVQTVSLLLTLGLTVISVRLGNRRQAALTAVLLLAYAGTKTVFLLRGVQPYYEPYFLFFLFFAFSIAFSAVDARAWIEAHRTAAVPAIAAVVLAVTAGQTIGNRSLASTQIPHLSARHFCEWQQAWAPILNDGVYVGRKCWKVYARAMDAGFVRSLHFQ